MSETPATSIMESADSPNTKPIQDNPEPGTPSESKVEESKDIEVSYESLVVTLKEKNKEIKKLEAFKKKVEDRYKEKVKENKSIQKEKSILEDFTRIVIPKAKLSQVTDSEGKFYDIDALQKVYGEMTQKTETLSADNTTELLMVIKEENENLKMKILELNEKFKKVSAQMLEKDKAISELSQLTGRITKLEETVKDKDFLINSLKSMTSEQSEINGKQLLDIIKATRGTESTYNQQHDGEDFQVLKQQLSEKTNRILHLQDQLQQSNENLKEMYGSPTASTLQQDFQISGLPLITPREDKQNYNSQVMANNQEEEENDMVTQMKQQLDHNEQMRQELVETIEQNKTKARNLLLKKDIQIQRLKIILQKFEHYLKSQYNLTADQIQRISVLQEDDLKRLSEIEQSISPEGSNYHSPISTEISDLPAHQSICHSNDKVTQQRLSSQSITLFTQSEEQDPHIVYLRNVFVKYLEYLTLGNTREIKTIENVLFSELQVTKEQANQLDTLRKTNSFWKKIVQFSSQPVVNTKMTAGDLKKKFLGGVSNFMPTIGRAINHQNQINAVANLNSSSVIQQSPNHITEGDQDNNL